MKHSESDNYYRLVAGLRKPYRQIGDMLILHCTLEKLIGSVWAELTGSGQETAKGSCENGD